MNFLLSTLRLWNVMLLAMAERKPPLQWSEHMSDGEPQRNLLVR